MSLPKWMLYGGVAIFLILHATGWYLSDEIIRTVMPSDLDSCGIGFQPIEMRSARFCISDDKAHLLRVLGLSKFLGLAIAMVGFFTFPKKEK